MLSLCGLCLLSALAGTSACATATAKPRTDPSPLAIPEPPPRVVEPLPEVEELPAESPRRDPSGATPRPSRTARENEPAPKPEPKPDPPKPDPAAAEPPPAAPPAAPQPRAELRTADAADEQEAARHVRETLDRAARTLANVDYRRLRGEGRQQYDTAKRFIEQAEEALKERNHVAAVYLAGKADTIAKGLTGR